MLISDIEVGDLLRPTADLLVYRWETGTGPLGATCVKNLVLFPETTGARDERYFVLRKESVALVIWMNKENHSRGDECKIIVSGTVCHCDDISLSYFKRIK